VLTAGYILWAVQRVYLGPEYKGPHGDHLTPSTFRENLIGTVLCVFAVIFGVYPRAALDYMDKTIDAQVNDLKNWTRDVKEVKSVTATTGEETERGLGFRGR
jgi:NADH-quinone oxidoreductase subunit M